jgi:hypothetical protein
MPPSLNSGFKVTPAALDAFGTHLHTQWVKACESAQEYISEWIPTPRPNGVVGDVLGDGRSRITDGGHFLVAQLRLLSTLFEETGQAIKDSGDLYRKADILNSIALDQAYNTAQAPGPSGPPMPPLPPRKTPGGYDHWFPAGSTGDPVIAVNQLTEPAQDGGVPENAQNILDIGGYASFSTDALAFLKVAGIDVVGWVTQHFGGDSVMVFQAANAVHQLAEFENVAADQFVAAAQDLFSYWTGAAASACAQYLSQIPAALRAHATILDGVAASLRMGGLSLQQQSAEIGRVISALGDLALQAAIEAMAAASTEEIPIWDVIITGVAGVTAYNAVDKWLEAGAILDTVMAGGDGFIGLVTAFASNSGPTDMTMALPATKYHNTSQTP